MPSTLSLQLARTLKADVGATATHDGSPITPASLWWARPTDGTSSRTISYDSLAAHADKEYAVWRTVTDDGIERTTSAHDALVAYVQSQSVEAIAAVLDTVPSGVGADPHTGRAFDFLPWQRLSIAHWRAHLFDVTSRVFVDTPVLRRIAQYRDNERARKIPVRAEMSIHKGSCPDVFICDAPTASGKTAWSLAAAASLLIDFDAVRDDYARTMQGKIVQGPPVVRMARLMIVASAATTFSHFVDHGKRLAPRLLAMDETLDVVVWDTVSRSTSTRIACDTNALVMWFVPVSKLNTVLREHPDVTVPVVVVDEYTVDTPRERCGTEKSAVFKQVITQATPKALEQSTSGNRSVLKEYFGGQLLQPALLRDFLQRRNFVTAQLCAEQMVKLDLMTMMPFRAHIRNELRSLVPCGLFVRYVRSARVTVASRLMGTSVDLVPANLTNVLLHKLARFHPTEDSCRRLTNVLDQHVVSPVGLCAVLRTLQSQALSHTDLQTRDRLCDRISEFCNECPICRNEGMDNMHMFGCCGYCVCTDCSSTQRTNACPFCRAPIVHTLLRAALCVPTLPLVRYPNAIDVGVLDGDFGVLRRKTQSYNLTQILHYLKATNHRRVVVVVERYGYVADLSSTIDVSTLSSRTGTDIVRVDTMLGQGTGAAFAAVKRRFDGPDPVSMALLCYGIEDGFLVGTDLNTADAIVVVGEIESRILTQAIGRVMRPNPTRDNSRPIDMFLIYS